VLPILGLRFSSTVDVTGLATAVAALATVGLAVTTAFLAKGTKRAAIATESEATTTRQQSQATVKQADATAAQVQLTRQQVEEAHRPLVVPQMLGTLTNTPGGLPAEGTLPIPLKNIGLGPAINVRVSFSSPPGVAPQPIDPRARGVLPGIGVGEPATAGLKTPLALGSPDFVIELAYDDVGGTGYVTTARWDATEAKYRDITTRPI
jgi:hypothetical protein